jgi:hypothetical protein
MNDAMWMNQHKYLNRLKLIEVNKYI